MVFHQLIVYHHHVLVLSSHVSNIANPDKVRHTEYTIPRLASAGAISEMSSVFVSLRSKYLKVLSNCSSWAGVRFDMFLDTICVKVHI